MKKAIIFDLDGTILDTINDIRNALNKTLGTSFSASECKLFVGGNSLKNAIRNALKMMNKTDDNVDELFYRFINNYKEEPYRYAAPYPGVCDFLKHLNNMRVPIVVFSNKEHELTVKIVSHCFPDVSFFMVIGRNGGFPPKPDPEALFAVAKKLNASMEELFYIGDSEVDADCAQRAGVESAILTCGMRSADYLIEHGVNPDILVCNMAEAAKRAML